MTKVKQLANNQFIITDDNEVQIFQSYETIIAKKSDFGISCPCNKNCGCSSRVLLDPKWNYSKTTSKYRRIFLDRETTKETQAKIDSGEYLLVNLNQ